MSFFRERVSPAPDPASTPVATLRSAVEFLFSREVARRGVGAGFVPRRPARCRGEPGKRKSSFQDLEKK